MYICMYISCIYASESVLNSILPIGNSLTLYTLWKTAERSRNHVLKYSA